MRDDELSEGYVIGLLADLGPTISGLHAELEAARGRAQAIDAELSSLLRRLAAAEHAARELRNRGERSRLGIGERNQRTATLQQEIAALKKRSDDYRAELERTEPGELQRRLRRERAKLSVQIEDRELEINGLRSEVEALRQEGDAAEAQLLSERDRTRAVSSELDRLQKELPRPDLYADLALALFARAHCELFVDGDTQAWQRGIHAAIDAVRTLHRELRAGKYRLDKNSELVGGRSMASAEAVHAAVAVGDAKVAGELFGLVSEPALFFHQIFNVFRVWCLGLYLGERRAELATLLSVHQYSEGLRGAYVQTYLGLLAKDAKRVATGLREMTKHEWEIWREPRLERGAGVVNVGAVALGRLALERGITVQLPGPTVPEALILGSKRRAAGTSPRPRGRPY